MGRHSAGIGGSLIALVRGCYIGAGMFVHFTAQLPGSSIYCKFHMREKREYSCGARVRGLFTCVPILRARTGLDMGRHRKDSRLFKHVRFNRHRLHTRISKLHAVVIDDLSSKDDAVSFVVTRKEPET